ncbi:unnamed protein product [Mytilus edulis]|uniref:Peptidase A2 domain-containing protein n=1 Tax=Mytilus edulis TaxID=6550 RepID=A0A8S3RI01_MYTED|nr:unnamed protein product [Mytilus edulis]
MNLRNRGLPLPIFSSSEGNSRMTPSLHTSTVQAGPSSLNMGNSLGSVSINSQSSHTYTTSPPIQSTYSFPYGAQSTYVPIQSAPSTYLSNYSALSTNLSNQSVQNTFSQSNSALSTIAPVQSAPSTYLSDYSALSTSLSNQSVQNTFPQSNSALSTNLSNQSVQNTFPQSNSALSTNLSNQSVQNTFPQSISALSTSYPYHCAPSAMSIPQRVLNTQNKATIDMTYDQTVNPPRMVSRSDTHIYPPSNTMDTNQIEMARLREKIIEVERERDFLWQNSQTDQGMPSRETRGRTESMSSTQDGYRSRLPFYNGKEGWSTFLMQFEIIADRNNWDPRRQAEEILLILKDEAANFAAELPYETRSSFRLLSKEMESRFGDNNLPETYRKELQTVRKGYKESTNEYAARIQTMVKKAYPGMNQQLFNSIAIEHMLNGLPDQSIAYDVLTKRPKTMEETINLVAWHTTCKNEPRTKSRPRGRFKLKRAETDGQVSAHNSKSKTEVVKINQTSDDPIERILQCLLLREKKEEMLKFASVNQEQDFVAESVQKDQGLSSHDENGQNTGADEDVILNTKEEIVIDRITAASIKVPMEVSNQKIKAVIDTGAEVTVLNEEIFFRLPKTNRSKLKPALKNLVVAEAGKQMGTKGVAAVTLTLGDSQFVWDVYVAPIGDDLLLGCDVLDEMDITVNSRKGIQLNGKWIECEVKRKSDLIARVVLDSNFTIPPSSEVILYGCGQNQELLDTRYSMIQPVIEDSRKFMVAQTLVDPFMKNIPVRLINLDSEPIRLKKNYLLGELHPVDYIENMFELENDRVDTLTSKQSKMCKTHELLKQNFTLSETIEKANIPEKWESEIKICKINELNGKQKKKAENQLLPEHLKDLYERSSKDIESESIKEKLAEVLQKNICTHSTNSSEDTCKACEQINEQWKSFKTEVDDVKELNYKVTVRAVVTRSQEQSDWLAKYSVKEMQGSKKKTKI